MLPKVLPKMFPKVLHHEGPEHQECPHDEGGGNDCHADATCTNTDGSFACECNSGWSGAGVTASPNDDCTATSADSLMLVGSIMSTPPSARMFKGRQFDPGTSHLPRGEGVCKHPRWGSNPQPPAPGTDALPLRHAGMRES